MKFVFPAIAALIAYPFIGGEGAALVFLLSVVCDIREIVDRPR